MFLSSLLEATLLGSEGNCPSGAVPEKPVLPPQPGQTSD